jgi:hypothetical protein
VEESSKSEVGGARVELGEVKDWIAVRVSERSPLSGNDPKSVGVAREGNDRGKEVPSIWLISFFNDSVFGMTCFSSTSAMGAI